MAPAKAGRAAPALSSWHSMGAVAVLGPRSASPESRRMWRALQRYRASVHHARCSTACRAGCDHPITIATRSGAGTSRGRGRRWRPRRLGRRSSHCDGTTAHAWRRWCAASRRARGKHQLWGRRKPIRRAVLHPTMRVVFSSRAAGVLTRGAPARGRRARPRFTNAGSMPRARPEAAARAGPGADDTRSRSMSLAAADRPPPAAHDLRE